MYSLFKTLIFLVHALENLCQFFAVVMLFYLLLYVLYILFVLAGSNALDALAPFANVIMNISDFIWGSKFNIYGTDIIKEFTTGILLLVSAFLFFQFVKNRLNFFTKFITDMQTSYRINKDKRINEELHRDIKKMNKKIKACLMYIELKPKDNTTQINMEEQYKLLNHFLYNSTGIMPIKEGEGFIYKFSNIEKIDKDLPSFLKALKSKAPIDYLFIFQVIESSYGAAINEINKLSKSGLYNKIILSPTTKLRYEYKQNPLFTIGVAGNYVFEKESHSIYEIRENFF